MGKIVVEDYTQPPKKEEVIDGLASALSIYASSLGLQAGLEGRESTQAALQAAEEMTMYLMKLERMSEEEVAEMRARAVKDAERRIALLEKSGSVDKIRAFVDEAKAEKK